MWHANHQYVYKYSIKFLWYDCQWLATGGWFTPDNPVSSTNKTDCHDITEILLKVAFNTINPLCYGLITVGGFDYTK